MEAIRCWQLTTRIRPSSITDRRLTIIGFDAEVLPLGAEGQRTEVILILIQGPQRARPLEPKIDRLEEYS